MTTSAEPQTSVFRPEPIHRSLSDVLDTPVGNRIATMLNLMDNDVPGHVAEAIVTLACDGKSVGNAWWAWDVEVGELRIEAKASGENQAWEQTRPSNIDFRCGPKTAWESERATGPAQISRNATLTSSFSPTTGAPTR
jgi:hypothetical protein